MIGFSDDDALAAEYVVGTLDYAERMAVEARRRQDPAFDEAVKDWETRLAPLALSGEDVRPSADLLPSLLRRLDLGDQEPRASNVVLMQRKLRVWRGIAAVASALAAMLAVWIANAELRPSKSVPQTYVAVLQQGTGSPSFVVSLDLATRRMAVVPIDAVAPAGKSYELWMIGADKGIPQSLGVIEPKTPIHPALPQADSTLISNATYAVTLEAQGGSPTGKPTGAPLFAGKLLDVDR